MTSRPLAQRLRGLFVVADDNPCWRQGPVEQARAACEGGAAVVQLRAKRATDRAALEMAADIRSITRARGALFFINDRFDLALLAEADGVHLGQDDIGPACLPAEARRRLLIGRSTHTLAQARAARAEPVDYVAFGPVFETHSKDSPYDPRGLALLTEAVRSVAPHPVIAIGGIDLARAASVVRAGAAGAAVISAVAGAVDPVAAARALARALEEAVA
ncbi:MAG TPA: thiamine phosphate synthase [Myxococcota bacterium]|nr:thiamine phosphate synthase [Myxococcota bacterium]